MLGCNSLRHRDSCKNNKEPNIAAQTIDNLCRVKNIAVLLISCIIVCRDTVTKGLRFGFACCGCTFKVAAVVVDILLNTELPVSSVEKLEYFMMEQKKSVTDAAEILPKQ